MRATFVVIACMMAAVAFAAPLPQTAELPSGAASQSIGVQTSAIPSGERQALMDLYNSTNGASWSNKQNWRNGTNTDFNLPGTECTWYGVQCDQGGTTVQQLGLSGDNLVGTIPSSIANLTNLQSLNLNSNHLTGSIPAPIEGLTKLQGLYLNNNQLSGTIPSSLGSLTSLQSFLDLGQNQLSGTIPSSLGGLTNLQYLILSNNQLSGSIPAQFGGLANLYTLDLSNNQLSGSIPSSLGNLATLVNLRLNGNQLSGAIPTSLTNLTNLANGYYWWSDLTYNALWSNDGTLIAFLNSKQRGGDWQSTQTVAPGNLAAGAVTASSIALSWVPMVYQSDPGGYQAFYSTVPGGPYTAAAGVLGPKSASSGTVAGLNPATTYYIVVRSFTNPSNNNQNLVTSDPSAEVHATTSAGSCTSPSITSQPQSVSISSGQTATLSVGASGSTPLSYQWYQGATGDTSAPVGSNADSFTTSALAATTSYWVRVGNSCGHADSATATITVYTYFVWVPVASHNGGLNNSQWRSDLGLLNTGNVTANVQIKFFGSSGVASNTTYVSPQVQSILTDVVGQLNGSNSGALEILSDQPLKVTARSYNQVASAASCYAGGTQGQDYPAVVASDGLSSGQSAYLAGLTENGSFHCNIGVVNVGSGAATVLVELFNGAGSKLTDYTVSLNRGDWKQETQPFYNKAAQTAMDRGYAKITVQTGSGVFGFASVIDNITSDPTTVAMQR